MTQEEFAKQRGKILADHVGATSIREADIVVRAQLLLTMKGFETENPVLKARITWFGNILFKEWGR